MLIQGEKIIDCHSPNDCLQDNTGGFKLPAVWISDNSWRQSLFKRMNRRSTLSDHLITPERRWYYCIQRPDWNNCCPFSIVWYISFSFIHTPSFIAHMLAHKHKVLTLADSQHQLHGFGSTHPSISIIQTLQSACRGGWHAERGGKYVVISCNHHNTRLLRNA